jgi:hypothetical protein
MKIAMTDREPLERFYDIVQVGTIYGPYRNKRPFSKPWYEWRCTNTTQITVLLNTLRPWLSPRRIDQANRVLGECDAFDYRGARRATT